MTPGLLAVLALAASGATAADEDPALQAKRSRAAELIAQGRRLEALPLLEEVVGASPRDDEMLVDLAAALVDHAVTLSDPDAAGRERLRARDFLERAGDLGNRSPMGLNLFDLLSHLPTNGSLHYSDDPRVQRLVRAGEAAFSRRDFDDALENYSKALGLEPRNYAAALFLANTYDRLDDVSRSAAGYERAIALDPDVETAYRYYADLMARTGDMAKARKLLIGAAVAEPYNRMVWRELRAWARLNGAQVNAVYLSIPAVPSEGAAAGPTARVWGAYREARARFQSTGRFHEVYPGEKDERHSLAEESQALIAAASVAEDVESADPPDPSVRLLLELRRAGLVDAYVLFSLGDSGIARDYVRYRDAHRAELQAYLSRFVVPGS